MPLQGEFAFIVLTASILTLILSAVLLRLYRRATVQQMARTSAIADSTEVVPKSTVRRPSNDLRFAQLPDSTSADPTLAVLQKRVNDEQRQGTRVQLLAGLAFSLVITLAWLIAVADTPNLSRFMMLIVLFMWPTILALLIVDALGVRENVRLVLTYVVILFAVIGFVLVRNPDNSVLSLIVVWLLINLPPTLIFLLLLTRRIRAVGPLVFAFLFSGIAGAVLVLDTINTNDSLLGAIVNVGYAFGVGAISVFIALHLLGFVLFALVGRWLLRRVGLAYRDKAFSDRSITLYSLYLIFAVVASVSLAYSSSFLLVAGPLAFIAYALVVNGGSRRHRASRKAMVAAVATQELLLLRVFSLGRRSEIYFDRFQKLWRPLGNVNMIAGPDLVTASIEPHEFLSFAGGELSRSFVTDKADLEQRVSSRDCLPDPDGRYRVNEFFCYDNTWKITMQRLASESTAILMDLRSFSESNQGCLYELNVLLDTVDLRRIVFLVGETTDLTFLERSFLRLWSELAESSPNQALGEPTVRYFSSGKLDRQSLSTLICHLIT